MTVNDKIILQVEGLKKYFPIKKGFLQRVAHWIKAVDGVNLSIPKGQTLGLVGESGCGKSTMARLILKLLESDSGKIFFRGKDISRFSEKEMKPVRKDLQIVFQDPFGSLNPRMTIGNSISEGLRIAGFKEREKRDHRLNELLKLVGISPESQDRYPHEFSGGQRQRVGIARALSVKPSLMILDEPISALDVSIQAQIINLLKDLQDKLKLSYLFISHDLNVVSYLCNTVAVMYKGNIMEYASVDTLFEKPLHPYTISLLSAIPDPELIGKYQNSTGEFDTEDSFEITTGCKFQSRCDFFESQCTKEDIRFKHVGGGHYVRCLKAI